MRRCHTCQIELSKIQQGNDIFWLCTKCGGKIEDFSNFTKDSLTYIPPSLDEARRQKNFYKAQTCCLNCGWLGNLEKEKGQRVRGTPCPNCECKLGMED